MTAKFDKFKAALLNLCKEHDVELNTNIYYEAEVVEVTNGYIDAGIDCWGWLIDCTKVQPEQSVQLPPSQP